MPIYEYECGNCQKTIEAIQKFSDAPLTKCEACGGALTKLISRTSFQLKGTGWYATDYKKSPPVVKDAAKTEPKKEASTEVKPVAATEPKKESGSGKAGSEP